MAVRRILVVLFLFGTLMAEEDWTARCGKCKCVWSNGKKTADCRNVQLNQIPTDLSRDLRDIDFSNNRLYELRSREFSIAGLQDIHKVKLQNCSIEQIHELAFQNLQILVELDLSNNGIKKIHRNLFKDNVKLRIVYLSYNKIKRLDGHLFYNMTHLQKIHLDHNELEFITNDIFSADCPLHHLSLAYNKLTYIAPNFSDRLPKLSSLDLGDNQWICDCHLQPFRKLASDSNWITTPVTCQFPERLRLRTWSEDIIFACNPKVIEPSPNAILEVDTINYTIPCKLEGDPRPSVAWFANGRSVDTQRNAQKYIISSSKEIPFWDNLTIISINTRDRGEYKCVATNDGGSDERNVTLVLLGTDIGGGVLSSTSMSHMMVLIIVLTISAIVLLVIVFLLICCCCKRNGRNRAPMSKNRHMTQSNEFISMDGRPGEMEKALITDVNPVLKPPRQYSVPPSVNSGGTEVSEAKKMLIDNESLYAGDEESRSYDFEARPQIKAQNHLDVDYRGEHHYPPDLLSFPARVMNQISPAGSSASTVADTSRLPLHHRPQSPIHSPMYDTSSIYRTLPYSRSHSPFTSPLGHPSRVSRPGAYVTIPRRPRASWSSEPPMLSDIGEPLYDNLGLRTTATGASVLSLNKLATDSAPSTPRGSIRPAFPLSPQIDPIAEHESPPIAATLPRSMSAHRALSPNLESMRGSWARSPDSDSRRESTASLLPSSDRKTPKIPPRPPPKPKKRTSTGPLFEDEGEDGTEV